MGDAIDAASDDVRCLPGRGVAGAVSYRFRSWRRA